MSLLKNSNEKVFWYFFYSFSSLQKIHFPYNTRVSSIVLYWNCIDIERALTCVDEMAEEKGINPGKLSCNIQSCSFVRYTWFDKTTNLIIFMYITQREKWYELNSFDTICASCNTVFSCIMLVYVINALEFLKNVLVSK